METCRKTHIQSENTLTFRRIVPHKKCDKAGARTLYLECFLSLKKF